MANLGGEPATGSHGHSPHRDDALKAKHKVFLSHSGFQKPFVEHLCVELEGCYRFPFFDKRRDSLPIGENFPRLIFDAIKQCHVGVVILSNEFLTTKWPMMELVAMHERVLERTSIFKIMPIFLRTSIKDFDDLEKQNQWRTCWQKLARENPNYVDFEKCEAAVKYLRSINGLVYNGVDELNFQNQIVDEICSVVPPEIKYEDTYIQGKSRLCKVIEEKMIDVKQNYSTADVCVVGLYGMGGVGKSSICKALCNEFFTRFHVKVCYAELGKREEEKLLREVLQNLISKSSFERLSGCVLAQLQYILLDGIIKDPVFLALDNLEDASIEEAKIYLQGLPPGSIVMVTSRSKDLLLQLKINNSKCLEMPELLLEEARALFLKSSEASTPRNAFDEQLINRCVHQCYFQKDNSGNSHYHPLALNVLGRQLGRNSDEWEAILDKIDEDLFNQQRANDHPIFSILRTSFDALNPNDKVLFVDVALFLPFSIKATLNSKAALDWLGMVHGDQISKVKGRLETLKRKALLESVADGTETCIGMHDLWRAFCRLETDVGELSCRQWLYETYIDKCSDLVESSPSGSCWEKLKRMAFLDCTLRDPSNPSGWERANFAHFSNVTVLHIGRVCITEKFVLDLSALIHLKSLEIFGFGVHRLVLQGLPRSLTFLTLISVAADDWDESDSSPKSIEESWGLKEQWESTRNSGQLMKQIGSLDKLQYLLLKTYEGAELPDMRSMSLLRCAYFSGSKNVVTVTGFSSKLATYLRILVFEGFPELRSCPGVDDLAALEQLKFKGCRKLKMLPNLRKLSKLRILDIFECPLITEVPGLDELNALEELYAGMNVVLISGKSSYILRLPNMEKLSKLRVLSLPECRLGAVQGLDRLSSLQELQANFRDLKDKPSLRRFTKLQRLFLGGWSAEGLRELDKLTMLHTLEIRNCCGVDELPDLRNLIRLRSLSILECEFKNVSSVSTLGALESLFLLLCSNLEIVPALHRLTRLETFFILGCPIEDVTIIGDQLPRLRTLELVCCWSLRTLTSSGKFFALSHLKLGNCGRLTTLPDLYTFPGLTKLELQRCSRLTRLCCSGPLKALKFVNLEACISLNALPDLGMFLALEELVLTGCDQLTTLSTSTQLPALKVLNARGCWSLKWNDLCEFQLLHCPQVVIEHDVQDIVQDTYTTRILGHIQEVWSIIIYVVTESCNGYV